MILNVKTPQLSLSSDLLRFRPSEREFDRFKTELLDLQQKIDNGEREDHQKTYIQNFLRDAFYRSTNDINSKGNIDLAIHLEANAASRVGVIIEVKSPSNKSEMLSAARPNAKAMHELVLYFMRERVDEGNDDLRYLIATNINEWFVFPATDFNRLFYNNGKFRKTYEDWRDKLKVSSNTDHFYAEIVRPFIAESTETIECTHFDLREFSNKPGQRKLIALYKILSPFYLLKRPFADDSNTLDKRFYTELLHIIGLEEYKEKSKTLIRRKSTDNTGSLLEMAITMLDTKDVLTRIENPGQYGATRTERLEAIALELCITWINRILFLKLLEAQLVNYHGGNADYRFLNLRMVRDFAELFALFHNVLAKTTNERIPAVQEKFQRVPYLNSSLFETTDLEDQTITIESLSVHESLPVIGTSILRKPGAKADSLLTLEYLFRFLDAYDFASEGKEEIQKENRALINASVLGKVFEKINGYKDGSIYTPGFITMYMCRQAIRLAVVQKFKDETEFDGADFDELANWIGDRNTKKEDILRCNALIDSLKICDPAVGSGHFLVSALNEILAIKSELRIFADSNAKRFTEYTIEIVNDELIITDRDNHLFEYEVRDGQPLTAEVQRLQSTLFHEKQTIIENCLFGVDINPNSVKICRLRLWIELLKNAYYKSEPRAAATDSVLSEPGAIATGFPHPELETLPNIDINIKQGNSLISRFALDDDLAKILKQVKFSIDDYRSLVRGYKETRNRNSKRDFENRINRIKDEFKTELLNFSPEVKKLVDLQNKLNAAAKITFLFGDDEEWGESKNKAKTRETKIADLTVKVEKQRRINQAIIDKAVFKGAFEWRFEFPEVLDNNGTFLGFDVIVANPPYISAIDLKKSSTDEVYKYLKGNYETAKGAVDAYVYFFERALDLLKDNCGLSFISPNRYLSVNYAETLRKYLFENTRLIGIVDFSHVRVFEAASTYPLVTILVKEKSTNRKYDLTVGKYDENLNRIVERTAKSEKLNLLDSYIWGYLLNEKLPITERVIDQSVSVLKCAEINATSTASEADAYHALINEEEGFRLINTGTIDRYETLWGITEIVDKGSRYLKPYLPKTSKIISKNRKELYSSRKIVLAKIAISTEAFYDEDGIYASINTNCFHSFEKDFDPKYVLAWLNSRLFQYTFECFFEGLKMAGGYLSYSAPYLSKMYIKRISTEEQLPFVSAVDRILRLKKSGKDSTDLEEGIDQMVYKLYNLTDDEIAIIEGRAN